MFAYFSSKEPFENRLQFIRIGDHEDNIISDLFTKTTQYSKISGDSRCVYSPNIIRFKNLFKTQDLQKKIFRLQTYVTFMFSCLVLYKCQNYCCNSVNIVLYKMLDSSRFAINQRLDEWHCVLLLMWQSYCFQRTVEISRENSSFNLNRILIHLFPL